jgi:hypothetical protein
MKVSRCCGLILLAALCAGQHSTTFAQLNDSSVEVRTAIGGSADTLTQMFVIDNYVGEHDIESYDNIIDHTTNFDTVIGKFQQLEAHDEWIGSTASATGAGFATAHAAPGDLGVSVSGATGQQTDCCDVRHVPAKVGTADVGAKADAFWTDGIVINDPNLPIGKVFFMRSKLTLDGHISAGGEGATAQVTLGAGVGVFDSNNNISAFSTTGSAIFNGVTSQTIPNATTIPIYSPIQNGIRNTLFFSIGLTAESHAVRNEAAQNSASFEGDYSGSLHWGGIQDIEDANGNILTGWTITSDSGFDFTRPFTAPEAGTTCLAAQLLALSVLRRSRRAVLG